MSKRGRPNQDKIRVNMTIDKNIFDRYKALNVQISTLINNLLIQHLSLYSNHSSPNSNSLITRRSMVQIHPSLFEPSSEIGDKGRENTKFEDFANSALNNTKQQENLQKVLFSVYKIHKEKFIEW